MEDSPVVAAHQYAAEAESWEDKEEWSKAADAHFRAAELFYDAVSRTSDAEAVRTLKLLCANHSRKGREIQRRLSRPNGPIQVQRPQDNATSSLSNIQQTPLTVQHSGYPSEGSTLLEQLGKGQNPAMDIRNQYRKQAQSSNQPPSSPLRGHFNTVPEAEHPDLLNSQFSSSTANNELSTRFDGSYMVLRDPNDDDDADPFNKFWEIVEGLVQKLSNPVAFTTIPLVPDDASDISSPSDRQHSMARTASRSFEPARMGQKGADLSMPKADRSEHNPNLEESYFLVPENANAPNLEMNRTQGNRLQKLSSTAHGKPSMHGPFHGRGGGLPYVKPNKSIEEYAIENEHLKATIDQLTRNLYDLQQASKENTMLKSSIVQFKLDLQKQAKKLMQSQDSLRNSMALSRMVPLQQAVNNLNLSAPNNDSVSQNPTTAIDTETDIALRRRILELESEVKSLKQENDRQNNLMAKYKERWEKLKESAKKRRMEQHSGHSPGKGNATSTSLRTIMESNLEAKSETSNHTNGKTPYLASLVNAQRGAPFQDTQSPPSLGSHKSAESSPLNTKGEGGVSPLSSPTNQKPGLLQALPASNSTVQRSGTPIVISPGLGRGNPSKPRMEL